MCIITGPVRSVQQTKIFVMPSTDIHMEGEGQEQRQLTVYKNNVHTVSENMMILPVPWPETVRFEEEFMKTYPTLFTDLEKSLYRFSSPTQTQTLSFTRSAVSTPLPVLKVGSYEVSVVPSAKELSNLNTSVFSLSPELKGLLAAHYSAPFGFLCCKLRAGLQSYEPLAYSHRRWKQTSLFVPTMHYHAHVEVASRDVLGYSYFGEVSSASGLAAVEKDPEWDHSIYSMYTESSYSHASLTDSLEGNALDAKRFPRGFEIGQHDQVRCWEKKGVWKNVDVEFPLLNLADTRWHATLQSIKNALGIAGGTTTAATT